MACFMTSGTSRIVDDRPPLLAEFAQELALGRDDPQRNLGLVVGQASRAREAWATSNASTNAPSRAPTSAKAEDDGDDIEEPAL